MTKAAVATAGETGQCPMTIPLHAMSIDPMNVRRTAVEPAPDFVANIQAQGVEIPLMCRPKPGKTADAAQTFDGGKRLRALWRLKNNQISINGVLVDDNYPVPVLLHDLTDDEARAMSLSLAIHREDLHAIDRFEAFAELIQNGESVESLAVTHGMTAHAVRQALALGGISPKIRDAWRKGEISAASAQAFTLSDDHKAQDKLFARLKKEKRLSAEEIRGELNVADHEVGTLAAFLGEEDDDASYIAAGGKITRDLFEPTRVIVSDVELLRELAMKKLDAVCVDLVDIEGWGWAIRRPQRHGFYDRDQVKPKFNAEEISELEEIDAKLARYNSEDDEDLEYDQEAVDKLEARKTEITDIASMRTAKPLFKKTHGCMVQVDHEGKLEITFGVKALPKAEAKAANPGVPHVTVERHQRAKASGASPVSNALNTRLSEQLTRAAERVMRRSPSTAYAALIAGALSGSPQVSIQMTGLFNRGSRLSVSFVNSFASMLKAKEAEIDGEIAGLVAGALNFFENEAATAPMARKETAAVVNALDPKEMLAAIREAWDAKDYFAAISGAMRKRAVRECLGEDQERTMGKLAKDGQIKWCVTNVPKTGWLPPELRTAHYDGPSAAAKAKAKPAAKAKKKAKKKG